MTIAALMMGVGGIPIVKSIQAFTISSASNNATATINAVDTSKSIVIHNGNSVDAANDAGVRKSFNELTLTNSTTVTRSLNTTPGGTIETKGYVVEFLSEAVNSIQTFEKSFNSTSTTQTVTAVNTANSALVYAGGKVDTGSDQIDLEIFPIVKLTNSTTVTIQRVSSATAYTTYVRFYLIEFNAGYLTSNNQIDVTSGGTTTDTTITAVNLNHVIQFFGGHSPQESTNSKNFTGTLLPNNTTVRVASASSSSGNKLACSVSEFARGVRSTQWGTVTIGASSTSGTATITSIDTTKSIVILEGFTNSVGTSAASKTFPNIELTNSTTVTATRGSSSGNDVAVTVYFQIVTFI